MNKSAQPGKKDAPENRGGFDELGGDAVGLTSGTRVAGSLGWLQVEKLIPGNKVLTFDNGLQPIVSVEAGCLWDGPLPVPAPLRPLMVPHGTLGNAAELLLLPEQTVLLESDAAEALFGDPFALVTAACLEGFRGIRRVRPEDPVETVRLRFEHDQLIFAALGALFFCPSSNALGSITPQNSDSHYRILRREEAQALVARMSREPGFENDPFDPPLNATGRIRIVSG